MPFLKVGECDTSHIDEDDFSTAEEPYIPTMTDDEYRDETLVNFKKCLNRKAASTSVPSYYDYKNKAITVPRGITDFPPSYMLAAFLMTSFNLIMTDSFKVVKTLNTFNKRDLNRLIVYREGYIDFSKVHVNIKHIFKNTTVMTDKYMKIDACVIVEDELLKEMQRFIQVVNNLAPQDYVTSKTLPRYKNQMKIKSSDFLLMSPVSRLRILAQTVTIKRNELNVSLNIKKEIGNLGREYHLLTNIPRDDRGKISNLYGYDFESALQTIVFAILNEVNPSLNLSVTKYFVENKVAVRQHVVDALGVDMEKTKKIITAAYQGGSLGRISEIIGYKLNTDQKEAMKGLYDETKPIMEELLKVSSKSFVAPNTTLGSHFTAARWYASKRTSTKREIPVDFTLEYYQVYLKKYGANKASKFAKSYMFYLWTYFEGEARKVVQGHLRQPISLHDAVYTQDKSSFDSLNISKVENEIYTKIGIKLKLGEA